MKVIFGEAALRQTVVVPAMVAVGNGSTVTTAEPVCAWLQVVLLPSCTLTSVYVNVPTTVVDTAIVTELPATVVTVCIGPPFIV